MYICVQTGVLGVELRDSSMLGKCLPQIPNPTFHQPLPLGLQTVLEAHCEEEREFGPARL